MEISEGYVHYIWVIKPPFTMPKNPQVTIKMVSCRAPPRRFRRCCFWQRLWASRDRPWPWPRETSLPGEPLRIARSGCDNLTSPERAACLSGEVSGRCDLKWFGMNRNDPEWFGSIWNHLEWFGGHSWYEWARFEPGRYGSPKSNPTEAPRGLTWLWYNDGPIPITDL